MGVETKMKVGQTKKKVFRYGYVLLLKKKWGLLLSPAPGTDAYDYGEGDPSYI